MPGSDKVHSPLKPTTEREPVIKVSFPYPDDGEDDEALEETPPPSLKIDYTAMEIPAPRKTLSIRRSTPQTRLVTINDSLAESLVPKSVETPALKKNHTSSIPLEGADEWEKVLKSLSSLNSVTQENKSQISHLAQSVEKQADVLPKIEALQRQLDQSHKVETANQRLFDTMHGELKGYKDNFLFDALQKPVIRDLVALFDDLCGQARRIERFMGKAPEVAATKAFRTELQASHNNLNNTVFFVIEVLNRLDVTIIESEGSTLDLKQHKVVGVEPALTPDEKNQIARVVRPGFMWKDRILRPTEVIIKKMTASVETDSSSSAV